MSQPGWNLKRRRFLRTHATPIQFGLLVSVAIGAHLAGGSWFAFLASAHPAHLSHVLWMSAPLAAIAAVAVYVQWEISNGAGRFWPWLAWQAFGVGLVVLVAGSGTAVHSLAEGEPVRTWVTATWLLAASALCVLAYRRGRSELFAPRTRYSEGLRPVSPRKHLVLLLSEDASRKHRTQTWPDSFGPMPASLDEAFGVFDARKAADPNAPKWNWEIPFRGIQKHRSILTGVTLVPSTTSILQVEEFARIFDHWVARMEPNRTIALNVWTQGRDEGTGTLVELGAAGPSLGAEQGFNFEHFDILSATIRELIETLKEHHGLRDSDIQIDVTGGQKPTSIVAAAVTFRSSVEAQYVCTNDTNRVVSIDVVVDPALFSIG